MANEFKVKKGLVVDGTGTVLDIQGTQGQLFSVTDSLTGDLFSVSDISGVPILNVNSSGLVTIDGDLNLGDSNKIQLGNSQDLQLYHDGTNSYISDNGTGDLRFNANGATRFKIGSDVASLTGTDFAIAAGRKLYLDGQSNTYITESSADTIKFFVGGQVSLILTDNAEFAGSVTATSLDVNGVADISGVLSTGSSVYVNQGSDLTTQALQVNGFIDITDVAGTALRWFNGTTFKGGLGLDDWAHSGSSNDITMYIAGDNSFFVSTNNVKRLEIDSSGSTFSHDLTFGSTGGNGAGRLIIRNDTSGNQGTAGLGVLKQRDVNRQAVAGQSTHTGGYIWYTIKIPSGYSNSGLGSDVEVVIRTGGKHHNGKTLQKYIISVGNGTTASIGNLNGINILQTLDSRIGSSYGGSATAAEFYYRTSVANDTGEVILRLYRADREPVTVVEINPQGAWNETDAKTPSLVCHGLGTTFDSGTGKGQINQTRPTSNLSTALVIQKASFEQTTGTNGKFTVSANGPANAHEIARFVNLGSLATSSHIYIGASSGTDWRLGKNIMGTSGNSNFEIAPHSGTTKYLEINSGNGVITANSGVYTPQYVQANQALIKSSNSHAVFGSNAATTPLGFARDSNHATYPDMTISSLGNMSVGGVAQYNGTGVKSINIVSTSYPVLAFYAQNPSVLYTSLFSYYNKTGFFHSASNATWEFNNGTSVANILADGSLTSNGNLKVVTNNTTHAQTNWHSHVDADNEVVFTMPSNLFIKKLNASNGYSSWVYHPTVFQENYEVSFDLVLGTPAAGYRHFAIALNSDGGSTNANFDYLVLRHHVTSNGSNTLRIDGAGNDDTAVTGTGVPNFADNTTRRIKLVKSSNRLKVYVNGVMELDTSFTQTRSFGQIGFAIYEAGAASTTCTATISNIVMIKREETSSFPKISLTSQPNTSFIEQNAAGALKVSTTHGFAQMGAENGSFCHFGTDRPTNYFNKGLTIDTGLFNSYDEDIQLRRGSSDTYKMTLSTSAATFTHDVVAYSDRKLKENIKTLDGSKVLNMRGVSFTRKDNGEESSGVIAQEMQEVAPELVNETDGTLGVSYGNITGYLIEAIKDLKTEIEELKKQIK